jgi:hypothetical protein
MTAATSGASRAKLRDDIRMVFDRLSDDALLDDLQLGALAGRSAATIKRWRRLGKTPPVVLLNGLPRIRVGDARPWLRGETSQA